MTRSRSGHLTYFDLMKFVSVNPYTEEVLAEYEPLSDELLDITLHKADIAQRHWRSITVEQRATYFSQLATLIRQRHTELATLATLEMGKPLAEAKAEVLKCARGCEFYATHAAHYLRPRTSVAETGKTVHVLHEPLGVILGIFPWNFPYWQILRSAVPTVMAGNAMIVKPAPNVPQCSMAIMNLINECGLPNGLIQVALMNELQVERIIGDDRIKAVTLTGSEKAGSVVASNAAHHIKKSVLELGGSDPFIVLDDADLDRTISQAITARFQNNGQSCIAAKRFILDEKIAQPFLDRFTAEISRLKCGNPLDPHVAIGPLARKDLRDKLAGQVDSSVKHGAKIHFQQSLPESRGFFYPPTVLTGINHECPAFHEELFGPVVSVFVTGSDEEAVTLANATSFGLGASVWSRNEERAVSLAGKIESGQVFINEMVKSQPSHPFGGVKRSGYGRELGEYGLYEFCNVKAVWI